MIREWERQRRVSRNVLREKIKGNRYINLNRAFVSSKDLSSVTILLTAISMNPIFIAGLRDARLLATTPSTMAETLGRKEGYKKKGCRERGKICTLTIVHCLHYQWDAIAGDLASPLVYLNSLIGFARHS
jgi:hypothetical protein